MTRADVRPVVASLWLVFVLATERWYSWHRAVALNIGGDMPTYESMARAAPSLPDEPIRTQHAQRFPIHWLVGSLAQATGLGLHLVYWIGMGLALGALVLVMHLVFARLRLEPRIYAICFGALVGSAYAFRYLLIVPGMVADAVFLVGLALFLLALLQDEFWLLVGGLLLAMIARQTALPLVLLAAVWLVKRPGQRAWRVVLVTALPLGLYAAVAAVASSFAKNDFGGFSRFTIVGSLDHPRALAAHCGRLALGIAVPVALVAGGWIRTRRGLSRAAWASAAAAALVIAQPLLFGPAWVISNEARLAALATPALVVLVALVLREARLGPVETVAVCLAVALGSFQHLYTRVAPAGRVGWVALELAASVAAFLLLARPRLVAAYRSGAG